jgi:hypothetical protein
VSVEGAIRVRGANGSIHANRNLASKGTDWRVDGDVTASGTLTGKCTSCAGGETGGGRPKITVPNVQAEDYAYLATHILGADGQVRLVDGTPCTDCGGWSFSAASRTWSINSGATQEGTFFVEGDANGGIGVQITGDVSLPGRTAMALSIIATGSISISGEPVLKPHNALAMQFVTNGDLTIAGQASNPLEVEGRSLVREQLHLSGNPKLSGQIIVQDFRDCGDACWGGVTENSISGDTTITYDGTFDGLDVDNIPPAPTVEYVHNVVGWIEGM